jgi:serpin B
MKKILGLLLMVLTITALVACSVPVSGSEIKSDKPRQTSPAVSDADMTTLVEGNGTFAFNLYQQLKGTDGNLFYSPYSISAALAMTYAGARNATETQMKNTLQFLLAQARLHPAFNKLAIELASRGKTAQGKDGEGFRLNVVNAIWGQKDYQFQSDFLDTLAVNYSAGLRILDFISNPEQSRVTINDWVAAQTENRIKDLIPQGAIDTLTRLVLTNAIYFNAAWQYPFNDKVTANGTFNLLNGSTVTVPMMKQTDSFAYFKGSNFQAVELPYDGQELSMVILLPDAGQFTAFENSMNYEQISADIGSLNTKEVNLSMPKFEFDADFSLKQILQTMGMPIAFTDQADFSGMTGDRDLQISDVIHKAFVSVAEAGTEAAAATAVIMTATAMPTEIVDFNLDRPFIFLIRDIQTGAILFIGRVMNPAS